MVFVLLSAFMFAFNNVLWKQKLIVVKTNTLVAYRAIFTSSIAVIITLIFCESFTITTLDFIKISSGSILGFIGLWCMLVVISHTSLQWLAVYNLVGVVLNALYLIVYESYNLTSFLFGGIFIIYTATSEVIHMINLDVITEQERKPKSANAIIFSIVLMNLVSPTLYIFVFHFQLF